MLIITQEQLKENLHYNPDTGEFTRITVKCNAIKRGIIKTKPRSGYIWITVCKKIYPAHRLAWFYVHGVWPEQIDHINHAKDDNRISNLRDVTSYENSKNLSLSKRNNSGIVGVCWCKYRLKWVAQIHVYYKSIPLGRFNDKFEAICARKSAELKHGYHKNHGAANCR